MFATGSKPGGSTKIDVEGEITAMGFVAELWKFMRVRKKFWLIPVLVMMALLGGLIVLTQGSAIAPFIYTIF